MDSGARRAERVNDFMIAIVSSRRDCGLELPGDPQRMTGSAWNVVMLESKREDEEEGNGMRSIDYIGRLNGNE